MKYDFEMEKIQNIGIRENQFQMCETLSEIFKFVCYLKPKPNVILTKSVFKAEFYNCFSISSSLFMTYRFHHFVDSIVTFYNFTNDELSVFNEEAL